MTLNTASILGRLGRDIELKYTNSGKAVASFGLAVNDKFNKEKTYWIDCVAWGKAGELLAQYTKKGSKIAVSGSIQTREWEDKSGGKRKTTEINVQDFEFLDSKQDAENTAPNQSNNVQHINTNQPIQNANSGQNFVNNQQQGFTPGKMYNNAPITDNDLPF